LNVVMTILKQTRSLLSIDVNIQTTRCVGDSLDWLMQIYVSLPKHTIKSLQSYQFIGYSQGIGTGSDSSAGTRVAQLSAGYICIS